MNFSRAPLPLAIVVVGGLLTAALWRVESSAETAILQRLLNEDLNEIAVQVEQEIQRAGGLARRQARHWALLNGTPRAVWDSDAQNALQLIRGVTGTAWVDASGQPRWIANDQGVRDADGNISNVPELAAAMAAARAANDLVFSAPYHLGAGETSISAFMPLQANGTFDGYQVTWVGLQSLLNEMAQTSNRAFSVSLTSTDEAARPANTALVATRTLKAGDTTLTVSAFAAPQFAKIHDPGLTEATLLLTTSGTLLCLVLGIMATRMRARRAELQAKNDELSAARATISTQDRRYRDLFARSDLGFVVTDRRGTLLEVNDTFVRITGYARREDLEGRPAAEITSDKDQLKLTTGLANIDQTTAVPNDLWTYRRADGSEAIVLVNTVIEGKGEDLRLICVINDITKSVLAERAAASTKSFYDGMFNTTDIAIFDMDYSGIFELLEQLRYSGVTDLHAYAARHPEIMEECAQRVRLNDMNQAALKLHGVRAVSDVSLLGLVGGEGPKYIFGIAEAMWNKQTRHHADGEFPRAGGGRVPVTFTLRVPTTADEAKRVPIMLFDRTQARAAADAREANIAKSRFLASMSHEIRTPLNGVIANLELLSQTNLDDSQIELLDDADKAATSLLALIGNILDFSKIEAGKLTVEMGDVQVDPLIREVINILQSKARQKSIFIDASVAEDVPEIIRGDAARLRQILLNLIGNAVKFTERGGVHVTVRVVDWDNEVCLLEFSVHDSGPGFRPSEGAKLFEAFTQAPGSSARSGEQGTGLGLSICRSLVETFGGEMIAVGMPGEGASFRFTLPAECLKRATLRAPVDLSDRAVLMVGTDVLSTSWVASYFAERRARIEWAATMDDALNACLLAEEQNRHFDLAVIAALNDSKINREGVRMLRRHGAAPLVVSESSQQPSWRGFLRSGVAVVITEKRNAAWFDRNIESLLGEVSGRGRESAAARELAGNLPDFSGSHVLVLEDRLVNQTVIQRQLKRFNLSYALAPNGSLGLLELKRNHFDLVLADCSMPVMDGFDFTREVRRQEKEQGGKRHLPIVALTANAFREDSEKCLAAGMDDFLSKPITLDRLAAALARWLKAKEPVAAIEVAVPTPKTKPINGEPPIDVAVLAELLGEVDAIALSEIFKEFAVAAHVSYDEVAASVSARISAPWRPRPTGPKARRAMPPPSASATFMRRSKPRPSRSPPMAPAIY